jgi:hypothetical protein
MPSAPRTDCHLGNLLDEANTLLLSAAPDVRQTAKLIGKLRTCADFADDDGDAKTASRMRHAVDALEKRLREQ